MSSAVGETKTRDEDRSGGGEPQTVTEPQTVIEKGKAAYERARSWPWLAHLLATFERYNDRRGNVYAASISFNGILALIPIVMVAFSIAGFVLAGRPDLIVEIKDAVIAEIPGELGTQIGGLIDSAISSRAAVGLVGLAGAALTGIGWMSGVRAGMTDMYGGRVQRNAVASKVWDLIIFASVGIAFALTMAVTALGNSGLTRTVLSWVNLDDSAAAPVVVRGVAIAVSVFASWMLFSYCLARLPLISIPFRNVLKAGLVTAVAFEIIKAVGGLYLQSVLSSPAGVAFGPVLGIMVFAYLASRIILYATAWCATDPMNDEYQVVEEDEDTVERRPVVISPSYEISPTPRPALVAGILGVGALLGAWVARILRR